MALPAAPLVNGFRKDWSAIEVTVKGSRYPNSFTEIAYTKSYERGEVRGRGPNKIGRTRGQAKCEASAKMFKDDFEDLKAKLGADFMNQPFDIIVNYEEAGVVITDTISGCVLNKVENSHSQGTDALAISLEFDVMDILLGGVAS